MTDGAPVTPSSPSAMDGKKSRPYRLITTALIMLIVAAVIYIDRYTPLDLRLLNYRLTPEELGRKVTFVSISPLSDLITTSGDTMSTRLATTIYTKIGCKAVQAAGKLDLVLKDARGKIVQAWRNIKLPPQGPDVKWAGFPLGGWRINLKLNRPPATPETWLEVTYTNPSNELFAAPRTPIQVTAK